MTTRYRQSKSNIGNYAIGNGNFDDAPEVSVIGPVAVCPFCSAETGYSVKQGAFSLASHRTPAPGSRSCPDSGLLFRPFDPSAEVA
jgi:hypothetical protein